MASKVSYGISKGYIAIITEDSQGNITYGNPIAVPGLVSLNTDPQTADPTIFYADNIEYYKSPAQNQGYEGDLVVALANADFLKNVLGQTEDSDGVLYENSNDVQKRFALGFQAEGDDKNRRFWFYDCTATRPSREHSTKEDSVEPGTDTIPITMKPRTSDGMVKCVIEETASNTAVYSAWFSAVHEKTESI